LFRSRARLARVDVASSPRALRRANLASSSHVTPSNHRQIIIIHHPSLILRAGQTKPPRVTPDRVDRARATARVDAPRVDVCVT